MLKNFEKSSTFFQKFGKTKEEKLCLMSLLKTHFSIVYCVYPKPRFCVPLLPLVPDHITMWRYFRTIIAISLQFYNKYNFFPSGICAPYGWPDQRTRLSSCLHRVGHQSYFDGFASKRFIQISPTGSKWGGKKSLVRWSILLHFTRRPWSSIEACL